MPAAPVVFVSYSHDSQEHKLWVLNLATRLRTNGVDAILDQWDVGPGGDLPHFMEQSLAKAARVLMICTERYVQKANAGHGGVGYEKMIVTAELMKQIGSNRAIPVVRQTGAQVALPTFLGSKVYIDLSTADKFETGFDQLLRDLLGAPLFAKPPLGAAPQLTSAPVAPVSSAPDPVEKFMTALAHAYESSHANGATWSDRVREAMGGSKVFFDHARGMAREQGLIFYSDDGKWIFPSNKGMSMMLSLKR